MIPHLYSRTLAFCISLSHAPPPRGLVRNIDCSIVLLFHVFVSILLFHAFVSILLFHAFVTLLLFHIFVTMLLFHIFVTMLLLHVL